MKIEKVTYQKTYSIGPYLTDRIGFEATLEERDTIEEGLNYLRTEADAWHRQAHPHIYQEENILLSEVRQELRTIPVEDREKQKQEILQCIMASLTLEDLKGYKLIASTSPELTSAYMSKLKELTK